MILSSGASSTSGPQGRLGSSHRGAPDDSTTCRAWSEVKSLPGHWSRLFTDSWLGGDAVLALVALVALVVPLRDAPWRILPSWAYWVLVSVLGLVGSQGVLQ